MLSPYYNKEIEIDGVKYPTIQHYIESQKFSYTSGYVDKIKKIFAVNGVLDRIDKNKIEDVSKGNSASKWKKLTKTEEYKLEENGDPNWWIGIRENIVRKVLEERFNKKNKDFIDILKATYPSQLIYEQPLRNKSIEGDYLEDIYGKILMEIREKLINEDKKKKNKSGGSNIKLKRDSVKNTEFKKPKFLNNIISETNNTKTLQINFKPVKKSNNKLTLFDLKKIF